MTLSRLRVYPVLLVLSACLGDPPEEPEAHRLAVIDGTKTSDYDQTVFFMTQRTPEVPLCTAGAIDRDRCMVTADHCLENPDNIVFWMGEAPLADTTQSKNQPVASMKRRDNPKAAVDAWRDTGLVWLQNLQDGQGRPRIQEGRDYKPLPYGMKTIGPGPVNVDQRWGAMDAIDITLYGYGDGGKAGAAGVKRKGTGKIDAYWKANDPKLAPPQTGAMLRVGNGPHQMGPADSGAPLIHEDTIVADLGTVGSDGWGERSKWTFFDDTVVGQGNLSNKAWLAKNIELVCKKEKKLMFRGPAPASATIVGVISPPQTFLEGASMSDGFDCRFGDPASDCDEFVHQGQSVVFTADPGDPGWEFEIWEAGEGPCPCAGSPDPTCSVAYAEIGYYDELVSVDVSSCAARFRPGVGVSDVSEGDVRVAMPPAD